MAVPLKVSNYTKLESDLGFLRMPLQSTNIIKKPVLQLFFKTKTELDFYFRVIKLRCIFLLILNTPILVTFSEFPL